MKNEGRGSLIEFQQQLVPTNLQLPDSILSKANQDIQRLADFPTTKSEDFRYTRLIRLNKLQLQTEKSFAPPLVNISPTTEGIQIVFENGQLVSVVGQHEGVTVQSAQDVPQSQWLACEYKGFVQAMNAVNAQGGVSIEISKQVAVPTSITIIQRWSGKSQAVLLHHQIVLHAFASAHIEWIHEGRAEESFQNLLLDCFLAEGSQLKMDKLQTQEGNSFSFCTERIYQKKQSSFAINTLTFNAFFTRNDLEIFGQEEGTESKMHGVFMGEENNHIDNHTTMNHMAPHSTSNELYKGVLKGKASAVFYGKINVFKDAQKTNAFQSNRNLLLSDDASVNAKPALEIYADDVKCSHGSTTGQLDEKALFYLRSRGISQDRAVQLLLEGFLSEVINEVKNESLRNRVKAFVSAEKA
jgi:Fe-S cluster assembly protein SufD